MKQGIMDFLQKIFDSHQTKIVTFTKGNCHDCKRPINIEVEMELDGKVEIRGGAIYPIKNQYLEYDIYYKCDKCFARDHVLSNYQRCAVYSRTIGYYQPISNSNPGKRTETNDRKMFNMEKFINDN